MGDPQVTIAFNTKIFNSLMTTWMILGYPSFFRKPQSPLSTWVLSPSISGILQNLAWDIQWNLTISTPNWTIFHVHTYPKILVIRLYCKYEFAVQRTQYDIYICMYVCAYALCILVSIIYKFMGTTDSGHEVLESPAENGAASLRNLIWNHVPWRVLPEICLI